MFISLKFLVRHKHPSSSHHVDAWHGSLFIRLCETGLNNIKNLHGSQVLGLLFGLMILIPPWSAQAADFFIEGAANPELMRDIHVVFAGGNRLDAAGSVDGQEISISYQQVGAGTDIWNNEHNQVLAGVRYQQRDFSKNIFLPDGFATPQRVDSISASLHYKHITAGDWALSQSIQYTQGETDRASVTVQDSVDLLGLAAMTPEPGVAWVFGYIYLEKDTIDSQLLPVIEYVYAKAADKWSIIVGFPILGFSYAPHPDWLVGGDGLAVAYKVTQTNILRFAITQNTWAYGLTGPNVKSIDYTAQRVSLDWSSIHMFNHRTGLVVNALLGWEFNRELGADQKLSMDDTAVFGIEMGLIF